MSGLEATFRTVLEISWRASWLVLAVLALRAALRGRLPARMVFWAWIAVSIRLLLPFALPATWSPFNFAPVFHRAQTETVRTSLPAFAQPTRPATTASAGVASAVAANQPPSPRKLTATQWATVVWGAGVLVLVLARSWVCFRFARALRRSRSNPTAALTARLAESGADAVRVAITDLVRAPALHGILRPKLLFPPGFIEKLTSHELRLVVAHELAHLRRRDLPAQVLIHGAVIVHWFNPLVWIAGRLARADCELACDESVVRRLPAHECDAYGSTLLKIVSLTRCGAPPALGLGVVESKQQIKRRIQMIVTQPTSPLLRAVVGGALFALVTGLSLTAEIRAQPTPTVGESRVATPPRVVTGPDRSQWKFAYDATSDGLGALFPNGIVAIVGDKTIAIEDVRREVGPLVPRLQRECKDQAEFNLKISMLQKSVIKDLVARVVYIKEFKVSRPGEEAKSIPAEYIDKEIADRLHEQFGDDRAKFLDYLRTRGVTLSDYRHEIEEAIIYNYMRSQERKLNPATAPKKSVTDGTEGKVHLRMIQLHRGPDAPDTSLMEKANVILTRLKAGESFEGLATEFDESGRRAKGGDWGWQGPKDLLPSYSDKIFALKKGQASEPIIIQEGCFLFYVEDRK